MNSVSPEHTPVTPEQKRELPTIIEATIVEQESANDRYIEGRYVYELSSGEAITFKGRNEAMPSLEGRAARALSPDEQPQAGKAFERQTAGAEVSGEVLVVNATPIGVLDLALHLSGEGTASADLHGLKESFVDYNTKGGALDAKETALLDLMAAALYAGEEKPEVAEDGLRGLLDVARSLAGDQQATDALHEKMERLAEWDHTMLLHDLGHLPLEKMLVHKPVSQEALVAAEGVVMVHATKHAPAFDAEGSVVLRPTGEHTQSSEAQEQGHVFVPRQTVHVSLNHRVGNHVMGSFDGRYTIIAPATEALKANGSPTTLRDVDTYWTTGGEGMRLPKSVVVESVHGQDALVQSNEHGLSVKGDSFTREDLQKITDAYTEGKLDGLQHDDTALAQELLQHLEAKSAFTPSDSLLQSLIDKGTTPSWVAVQLDREHAQTLGFAELAEYAADRTGTDGARCGLDPLLGPLLNALVIDGTIRDQGGEVVTGGAHYVDSQSFQQKTWELASLLGADGDLHMGSAAGRVEESALGALYDGDPMNARKTGELMGWDKLPHAKRRAYIAQGFLAATVVQPNQADAGLFI